MDIFTRDGIPFVMEPDGTVHELDPEQRGPRTGMRLGDLLDPAENPNITTRDPDVVDRPRDDPYEELMYRIRDAEPMGTAMFMGWPDRWFVKPLWRCENGHVSKTVLRSEALGRSACLAHDCRGRVSITCPEDWEGRQW